MSGLRILYVPNEAGDFRQIGFRRPFANLKQAGLVEECAVFSLQWRVLRGGDPEEHRRELISRIRTFQPNIILMQHLGVTGLTDNHFRAMRKVCDFQLIYHEGDPYSRFKHPLPRAAKAAGRAADVVFTVGAGDFAGNFRRSGARNVQWAPSAFEPERFQQKDVAESGQKSHDVVIVANRNRPRYRGLPNWKARIAFVEHLQERFGDRLAIYGKGWTGVGAMGPVDFSEQDNAIRSGWVSANWDHFAREANYFSNRLPISLASGSIHATTRHAGYDSIFPSDSSRFLILGDSPRDLGGAIEKKLGATSPDELLALGRLAQEFAFKRFRQDDQLVSFLNFDKVHIRPEAAAEAWDLSATPLEGL